MIGVSALANNPGSLGFLFAPALSISSGGTSFQTTVFTFNLPNGSQTAGISIVPTTTGFSNSPAEIISSAVLGSLLDFSA